MFSRELCIICDQFTMALFVIVPKHQPNKLTLVSESQAVRFFHTSAAVIKILKAKLNPKIKLGHPTVFRLSLQRNYIDVIDWNLSM